MRIKRARYARNIAGLTRRYKVNRVEIPSRRRRGSRFFHVRLSYFSLLLAHATIRFYYLTLREPDRSVGWSRRPKVRFIFTPLGYFFMVPHAREIDAGSPRGKDLARVRFATDGLSTHAPNHTPGVHLFLACACMHRRADGIGRIINP